MTPRQQEGFDVNETNPQPQGGEIETWMSERDALACDMLKCCIERGYTIELENLVVVVQTERRTVVLKPRQPYPAGDGQ